MKKILITIISCLLLVGCGNKELDLETIKNNLNELKVNDDLIFENMKIVSKTDLYNMYSIDVKDTKSYLFAENIDLISSEFNFYFIIKDVTEEIEEQVNGFLDHWESQCEMYDQKNAQKIKNRLETTYNGYKIYIISDNNEKVLEEIKNS